MGDTISLTTEEQRRGRILAHLVGGDLTIEEAAEWLGVSVRHAWRLWARFLDEGPAALAHGNRGRANPRRIDEATRERVVELATSDDYQGANDSHLTELLAAREGITLSRPSVRRILRAAGVASPVRRRAPRHRSRRERMPREGMLVQVDGSHHDWLEGRGPWLTLVGAIDDATSEFLFATFRDEEDSAGYLQLLRDIAREHGLPGALYRDRHASLEPPSTRQPPPGLAVADGTRPTHVGRALETLGIGSIGANSPQAKGRIERGWGTAQGRLPIELRLAGAVDRASAEPVLADWLPRYNAAFGGRRPPTPSRPGAPCPRGSTSMPSVPSATSGSWPTTRPCASAGSCSTCPDRAVVAASRAGGSRCASSSMAASSWPMDRGSSSPPRRTWTPDGCAISRRPASRSGTSHRPGAARHRAILHHRTTPGVGRRQARSSSPSGEQSGDCQDHRPVD